MEDQTELESVPAEAGPRRTFAASTLGHLAARLRQPPPRLWRRSGRPSADAGDLDRAGGRRAGGRRLPVVLALATALVVAAGGTAWYAHHRAGAREDAIRQALATAAPAAKAIFSYDYRSFEASVANGRGFVTGEFAREYAETTTALKPTAESEQAVVLAEVSATGVVHADADRVELLLYLNQYRRNVNTDGEKVDQNRVVLELTRVGGEWKVSRASAI